MKKRMISLLLALAMCLSLCATVFAQDPERGIAKESLTSEQLEIYNADMKAFKRASIDTAMLTIDSIDESNKFTYQFNISDTIKNIMKISYTAETVTLDVYEDGRHNRMIYSAGGVEIDGVFHAQEVNTTRARASEYLKSPPPGFTTGSYTYRGSTREDRFDIKRKIATYTTTALCTVLGIVLFPGMGLAASVIYALIGVEVGELIQHAISDPTANTTTYMSYEINNYEHDNSMALDRLYKRFAHFYPTINCTGSSYISTYYYHNYFF